jgi:selenocysteine lyase/cysteine desulfurase
MNQPGHPELAKDVVYISPHKYQGAPGAPGLLIIKRRLLNNYIPTSPGGGTVSIVSSYHQRYVSE